MAACKKQAGVYGWHIDEGDSNQPIALAVPVLCFVLSVPLFLPLPPLHICRAKEKHETAVLHAPTPLLEISDAPSYPLTRHIAHFK